MRKTLSTLIVASFVTLAMLFAGTSSADASVITKFRQYKCAHSIKRHPCWYTVKYRVCYRVEATHRLLGCTGWRIYATWE